MAAVDDIVNQLPISQLAQQVGADEQSVRAAVQQAVPALVQGMQANAQDPGGETSLRDALGQHQGATPDPASVDTADGEAIVSNIFGGNRDAVVNQLGASGGGAGSDLLRKLLPILAPIVMGYIADKVLKGGGRGGGGLGDGGLGDIFGGDQGGQGGQGGQAPQQAPAPQQPPAPQGGGAPQGGPQGGSQGAPPSVPPAGQPVPEPVGADGQPPAPAPQGQSAPQQPPTDQGGQVPQGQAPQQGQGGSLGDILGDLLGGGAGGQQSQQSGGGLGSILGDLLGGGKKA